MDGKFQAAIRCLPANLSLTSMDARPKPMLTQVAFSPTDEARRIAIGRFGACHYLQGPLSDEVEQSFALWFRHAGGIRDCCFQLGF
jgi:hypothetical protein